MQLVKLMDHRTDEVSKGMVSVQREKEHEPLRSV